MPTVSGRSFDEPDETRTFPHGRWDIIHLGYMTAARSTLQPGWRWSEDMKPIVGTEWCQQHHSGYILEGRLGIKMEDGRTFEYGPGDAYEILPGHDGWTIGDEAVVGIEFSPSAASFGTREE
jgi:hypothetical protein